MVYSIISSEFTEADKDYTAGQLRPAGHSLNTPALDDLFISRRYELGYNQLQQDIDLYLSHLVGLVKEVNAYNDSGSSTQISHLIKLLKFHYMAIYEYVMIPIKTVKFASCLQRPSENGSFLLHTILTVHSIYGCFSKHCMSVYTIVIF